MLRSLGTVLLLALTAAPAAGEIIHLRDGRTLVGRIKRVDPGQWVVYTADHKPTYLPLEAVASIEVNARPTTDPVGAGRRLDALRRAVAHTDDPANAIAQYRRFTDAGADPASLAKAAQDVAVWQDRLDRRLVRLGDQWLPPAARAQAQADALARATDARELLKQGRPTDADAAVAAALSIDPDNVSALYLQGLLRLQQNQLPAARSAFEAVSAVLPDHGPTRANLAVVAWLQGRHLDALALYDEAMVLNPDNPAVLADASAALAGLPPALARYPVVGRVAQRCANQERQLDDRMTKAGMHRFGAAWLTDAEWAEVQNLQRQDQAKLDALTADFEKGQDKVRQIDLALADVEVQMRRTAVASATPVPGPWLASYDGGDGPPVLPVYYDLQNDGGQLRARRAKAVAELDALRRQAAAIRRRMAGEPEGGPAQRPIGPEGTPVRSPSPPWTGSMLSPTDPLAGPLASASACPGPSR